MKTILVLAAGTLQVPAVAAAKRMGLRVVALDGNPSAPGLGLADVAHIIDITDPHACLLVAQRERVDGVIHICSEVAMASLGLVNEVMGLHGPGSETVVRATNKEQMRRAFERSGAPSPRSIGVATADAAVSGARIIVGPIIVKPSRSSGSRGVSYLPETRSRDQVVGAFQRALEESRDNSVVVEQFVEGPEFSVEILIWGERIEILAITDKLTTGRPFFVEMGHNEPTLLGEAEAELVKQAAIRGVRALGLNWCAAHAEVKLAPDGPYLIEIGARLGGDFITTELVPRSTGVDMVAAAIRLSLGEDPDLTPRHVPKAAAIRYLKTRPGKVTEIGGVEKAKSLDGVKIVDVYVELGDVVGEIDSSLARAGHVIAEGLTSIDAVANAQRAVEQINISTIS